MGMRLPTRLIVCASILGLWLAGQPGVAFADPCWERAARVRSGELPYGQADPDCSDAGKTGALASGAAAGAAAAAAAAAARRPRGQPPATKPDDSTETAPCKGF